MNARETQEFLREMKTTIPQPIPSYSTIVDEIYIGFPVNPDNIFYKVLEGSLAELKRGNSLQRSTNPDSWLGGISDIATKIHEMGQHVAVRDAKRWDLVLVFDPVEKNFYVGKVVIPPPEKTSDSHSFYHAHYPPSHRCFGGDDVNQSPLTAPQPTTAYDINKREFRTFPHPLIAYVLEQDHEADTENSLVITKQRFDIPFLGKSYAGVMAEGRIYPKWPDTNTSLAPLSRTIALVPKLHAAAEQEYIPRSSRISHSSGIEARL